MCVGCRIFAHRVSNFSENTLVQPHSNTSPDTFFDWYLFQLWRIPEDIYCLANDYDDTHVIMLFTEESVAAWAWEMDYFDPANVVWP